MCPASLQGVIDYEEFIASMLDSQRVALRSGAVRSSFEKLDRDGDGYISVQDLALVCGAGRGVWGGSLLFGVSWVLFSQPVKA